MIAYLLKALLDPISYNWDPITPSVKYHPSSNALISTEQRGGVYNKYIYFITLIQRNITSQLQCISASAAGTSAIPVTDE